MSAEIFVIVLIAIAGAFAAGRYFSRPRPENGRKPDHGAKMDLIEKQWELILTQDRDLTEDEQRRYSSFIDLRNTVRISRREGRGGNWRPGDVTVASEVRRTEIQKAGAIGQRIDEAYDAWTNDQRDDPAAPHLQELCLQFESHLIEAGEINQLRQARSSDQWRGIFPSQA
jgi:hypothetical protein